MPVELRRALEELFGDSVDDVELREHSLFAWLHGRARATTRRNTIYLRGSLAEFFADPDLMLHEYFHVVRQWNRGRMTLWGYLAEWWRRGYWENRYERQARRFVKLRLRSFRRSLLASAAGAASATGATSATGAASLAGRLDGPPKVNLAADPRSMPD